MCTQRGGAPERTAALWTDKLRAGSRRTLSSRSLAGCAFARRTFLRFRSRFRGGHHFLSSTGDQSSVHRPPYVNSVTPAEIQVCVLQSTPMNTLTSHDPLVDVSHATRIPR